MKDEEKIKIAHNWLIRRLNRLHIPYQMKDWTNTFYFSPRQCYITIDIYDKSLYHTQDLDQYSRIKPDAMRRKAEELAHKFVGTHTKDCTGYDFNFTIKTSWHWGNPECVICEIGCDDNRCQAPLEIWYNITIEKFGIEKYNEFVNFFNHWRHILTPDELNQVIVEIDKQALELKKKGISLNINMRG